MITIRTNDDGRLTSHKSAATTNSGGTKRATSANTPLQRLQSSEMKFTMSRDIETAQVPPQARKSHGDRGGTFGAF